MTGASERSAGPAAADRAIGKIDRIEERIVRIPFFSPFSTSTATWAVKEALLLRIEGGGFTGWGECVADPDPACRSTGTLSRRSPRGRSGSASNNLEKGKT